MQRILQFLREVKAEFKNISWPKKESLIQLTFVVISISLIISLILGGADFIFTQGINLLGQSPVNTNSNPIVPAVVTIAPTITEPTLAPAKPTIIIKK